MSGPRLLITGASGMLGLALLQQARDTWKVIAVLHNCHLTPNGFDTRILDLKDNDGVRKIFDRIKPDWVCHCAALTDVEYCEKHPDEAEQVNVHLSRQLAEISSVNGAGFLLVSTDSVFDGKQGNYMENDAPMPVNVYAQTKLAAEKVVQEVHSRPLIVRTNLYGFRPNGKSGLVERILESLRNGRKIPGWTDVIFNPLFVGDLADRLLAIMREGLDGLYHVASSTSCNKHSFAQSIARLWELDEQMIIPTSLDETSFVARRPRNTSLCCEKVMDRMHWTLPDLQTGLIHMHAWEQRNLKLLRSWIIPT